MFDDRLSTNPGSENYQAVTKLQTAEEIDQAVATFKASDCRGEELMTLWQRIREAALMQFAEESHSNDGPRLDQVAGLDSY
jgi:hypothetical protein